MQVKISDSIKYIGVDDKTIDLFESQYLVPNGISYNSYLIVDEKVAIMDTVDKRKTDEWLENLDRELNGRTPDYLVIGHLEPDHASNIKVVSEKYPSMKLVGNAKTFSMLPQFFPDFDFADKTVTVKEGDELELGSHKLTFIMAPMVHWPEVMVSYESAEKVLFSADGFGTFGTLDAQEDDWACEARRYYFNICGKYGVQVQNLLKKAAKLDIRKICPLHGPVLDENLGWYICQEAKEHLATHRLQQMRQALRHCRSVSRPPDLQHRAVCLLLHGVGFCENRNAGSVTELSAEACELR